MRLNTTIQFGVTSYTYNGTYDVTEEFNELIQGTVLTFADLKSSLYADDFGDISYSIAYKVYKVGEATAKASENISYKNYSGNVFSYTVPETGNYKVVFTVSASAIRSASLDNTGLVTNSIGATGSFSIKYSKPNSAFTLIGYDGIGLNYGTNNVVYFGPDEAVFKYGDEGLKISKEGIQQLYKGSWISLGGHKKVNKVTANYTVTEDDEIIVFNTGTGSGVILTLPLTLPEGKTIYVKNLSSNSVTASCVNRLKPADSINTSSTLNIAKGVS